MRPLFLLVLLAGATFYTYHAFGLSFTTRTGRMGPGFFPQILGVTLLLVLLYSLVLEWRTRATMNHVDVDSEEGTDAADARANDADASPMAAGEGGEPTRSRLGDLLERMRDPLVMVVMSVGFVFTLRLLGGVPAMALFIFAALSYFDPGRHVRSAVVAVAVPVFIYFLFSVWLNSPIPQSRLWGGGF